MPKTTSTLYAVLIGTALLFSSLVFYLPGNEPPSGTGTAYVPFVPLVPPAATVQHRQVATVQREVPSQLPDTGRQTMAQPTPANGQQGQTLSQQDVPRPSGPTVPNVEIQPDLLAFNEGFNRMLQGNYAGAVESFERLTKQAAHGDYFDDALYWLGYSLAELGRDDDALVSLQSLGDRFPASPYADDALLKSGTIHQKRGDTEKAEECYQKALQRYPNSEASLSCAQNLATLQESRGEWKKAEDSWSNCDTQARNQLKQDNNYYSEHAKNRKIFIQANNDNEGKPRDLFNRGEILLAENRAGEAVNFFQAILRDFPDSGLAETGRFKVGICLQSIGRLEDARDCLSAVIRTARDAEVKEMSQKALDEVRKRLDDGQNKQQSAK